MVIVVAVVTSANKENGSKQIHWSITTLPQCWFADIIKSAKDTKLRWVHKETTFEIMHDSIFPGTAVTYLLFFSHISVWFDYLCVAIAVAVAIALAAVVVAGCCCSSAFRFNQGSS